MSVPELQIRWMIRRDMPQVLAIENDAFEFPWTAEDFIRTLRQRNCIGMVADAGGRDESLVIGTLVYELQKTRLRLLSLAVHAECRRCGVGRAMIDKLKAKLSLQRRRMISAEVCESNLEAHLFFRAQGFKAVSVVKWQYQTPRGCDVDAYAFRYRLPAGVFDTGSVFQPASLETFR